MGLLERGEHLATLVDRLHGARGAGRLVLISGEAGAGKSALVQEFRDRHLDGYQVLVGRCDDLFAARPLGPLADMARDQPGPLREALATGDQGAVFDAFLAELAGTRRPVVVVLEDLQWADEATLDLVRFVTRRLDALSCLILATHRVDLPADHPLRKVAGSLVGPLVTRLHVPPLSLDAVRTLTAGTDLDADSLHARTGGNPFFVLEVLAGEPGTLPATVRDTILARAAMLSGPARDALDAAAVLGREVDGELLKAVGDCDAGAIDECVQAGVLIDDRGRLAFRHDLTRQAIEEALTPLRRRHLHARALDVLGDDGDPVWRAHHAIEAGDRVAIVDLAGRAAEHCVGLGAFREAAALYGSALANADDDLDRDVRRRLLEGRATTSERVEKVRDAIAAGEELLELLGDGSDQHALATWESWIAGLYHEDGRSEDMWRALHRAVARLETLGTSRELGQVFGRLAAFQMISSDFADAIVNARRAQALAERCGDEATAVHALDTCGTAMASAGDDAGFGLLHEALDRAKRAGIHREVARSANNAASALVATYRPAPALPMLDQGLAAATEHELRVQRNCLLNTRSEVLALMSRWDDAMADVQALFGSPDVSVNNLCCATLRLGQLRSRRGDPEVFVALDEALTIAVGFEERQVLHPVYAIRAEAAWLAGEPARAADEIRKAIPLSEGRPDPWIVGELALWTRRSGLDWDPCGPIAEPFGRWLAGDVRGAAAMWDERECPYHAADALGDSTDVVDLREALERLTVLGARPRAQQVTRRLRELGVRDLPRGPRASTRANAAGLTPREVEVAALLVQGLANSEIARHLVLSPKTVDHHVSAVLSKLAVPSRRHVARAAARLGLDLDGAGIAAT